MFGDTRGWIISAVIAVTMGALLVMGILPQSMTSPTGTLTLAMQPASVPDDPANIVPAPGKDCDAAEGYRQAIDEYQSHEQRYENWADAPTILEARDARPPAVQMLIDARDCGKMNLFSISLPDVMTYDDRTKLEALNSVGTLCNRIALVYAAESSTADENHDDAKAKASGDEALNHATAAFDLGRHLYQERTVFEEWSDGISLMQDAVYALAKIEKDQSKAEAMKKFISAVSEYRRGKITRLWQIVSGIGPNDIATYFGDIFNIAHRSPEQMWRVEAILKLGRLKYMKGVTRVDQIVARKELAWMAADTKADPATRAAADAANSLTVEQFRMIK